MLSVTSPRLRGAKNGPVILQGLGRLPLAQSALRRGLRESHVSPREYLARPRRKFGICSAGNFSTAHEGQSPNLTARSDERRNK
jgi:hypothetical protein